MTITQKPRVSAILLDLDDTLYENTAMQMNVAENIRRMLLCLLPVLICCTLLSFCSAIQAHPFTACSSPLQATWWSSWTSPLMR